MAEERIDSTDTSHEGAKTVAGTVAHGEAPHAEPTALGMNAPAWVSLAMIIVLALMVWKKVPAAIGEALDRKIESIREHLDEATRLRAEAEALKNEYEAKVAKADAEAKSMLENARQEAEAIVEQAKTDAGALIERRTRMAEDKIGAAERAAIAEVRAKTASAAATAAAHLIAEQHDASADRPMVDKAISGLASTH